MIKNEVETTPKTLELLSYLPWSWVNHGRRLRYHHG